MDWSLIGAAMIGAIPPTFMFIQKVRADAKRERTHLKKEDALLAAEVNKGLSLLLSENRIAREEERQEFQEKMITMKEDCDRKLHGHLMRIIELEDKLGIGHE